MTDKPVPGPAAPPSIGSAPRASIARSGDDLASALEPATTLVEGLVATFGEQVRRSLEFELDGSTTSLAVVDHYLSMARDEDREPIVSLIAAGAGAYFGELIRREIGATWVGDGREPRRLRLLVQPQFVHFSPIDQAYEAIAGAPLSADDPRIAPGPAFDGAFGLEPPRPDQPEEEGDAQWLVDRLAELPPVAEDQFHSLTCRFETLQLMLELLATRQASQGRPAPSLGLADYVQVLTRIAS